MNQLGWFNPKSLVFLLASLIVSQPVLSKEQNSLPPINGTFVQLLADSHGKWSEQEWLVFFGYLEKLKISQLILQWTVAGDIAFFPSKNLYSVKVPPLKTILMFADRFKVKVNVGLVHDPQYWTKIGGKHDDVKIYLNNLLQHSTRAAQQLTPLVQSHKSFNGWYITEEIDDINWTTPEKRKLILTYLKELSETLHKLTPDCQIAISGFSNGNIKIDAFSEFWNQLLKQTKINLALFQDGIGVNKLTFTNLPQYLEAFKKITSENQRDMGIIIEIFHQTNGYPIDKKPFQAIPADLERINRQRLVASKFSQNLIAFSIPEYMTPLAGASADVLYNRYRLDAEQREKDVNQSWFSKLVNGL